MFTLKNSDNYSRTVVFLTYAFYVILGYGTRLLWKKVLIRHGTVDSGKLSMLAVLEPDLAEKMVERLTANPLDGYHLSGIVLLENPDQLTAIRGIPIVAALDEAAKYVCREWIDSVFISSKKRKGTAYLLPLYKS